MGRFAVLIATALVMISCSPDAGDRFGPQQMRDRAFPRIRCKGAGSVHGRLHQVRPRNQSHVLDVVHVEGRAVSAVWRAVSTSGCCRVPAGVLSSPGAGRCERNSGLTNEKPRHEAGARDAAAYIRPRRSTQR
jgi:hypothetical protein